MKTKRTKACVVEASFRNVVLYENVNEILY